MSLDHTADSGQPRLDIEQEEQLLAYLRRGGHIGATERPKSVALTGGVSNRAVYLRRPNGEAWVIKQALSRLRVEADWFSDPARIHREAAGLRWLGENMWDGCVPELVFEDKARHVLAMTAVPKPHHNLKQLLLAGDVQLDLIAQFGRLLGLIHRRGGEQRDDCEKLFGDCSFFESLRIEPYYCYAAEQTPDARLFLEQLIDETRANQVTVVHGDYSPKNVLVHGGGIVLLDHEVMHFGDPSFDIGFALTHLLSKAHHMPEHREALSQAARLFWQAYFKGLERTTWDDDFEARSVRHALGCLLARVRGRSPLEYLSQAQRDAQAAAVVQIMKDPPKAYDDLVEQLLERV